jgi:hypothetical protein
VTTFAAFTALCVFLPGIIGVAVGRWRVDRNPPPVIAGGPDEDRVDTDVFSAVRAEDAATGAAQPEAQKSAVATAERDAPTETIPTVEDPKTEAIPTGRWGAPAEKSATEDDAKTEVIRTGDEHTKPDAEKKD